MDQEQLDKNIQLDRERDIEFCKKIQTDFRNIESLQETCHKSEVGDGEFTNELLTKVRTRVVEAVCTPLLQNPIVEVMSMPASLIVYNDTVHTVLAKSVALKFSSCWIGEGPFVIYDAMTFEAKPATLEDILVMQLVPELSKHFELVLKEVSKLVLYVPLSLTLSSGRLIAKTRYSAFTAPY